MGFFYNRLDKLSFLVIRYKMLDVIFWLYTSWSLFHVIESRRQNAPRFDNLVITIIFMVIQVVAVYFTLSQLLKKLLYRDKLVSFFLSCLLTAFIAAIVNVSLHSVYFALNGTPVHFPWITSLANFTDNARVIALFVTVRVMYDFYETKQRNKTLERNRLEAELDFLKAQINPHFLFNALNSIYALINIDQHSSRETLHKFATLLRYQLYECSKEAVAIEGEIQFIKDYVSVEMLRKGTSLDVQLDISEPISGFNIPPFILITFVENAFKHVSRNANADYFVHIKAAFQDNTFYFSVTNACVAVQSKSEASGIGLQNVKKRLKILYAERHQLYIEKQRLSHHVALSLMV